MLLAANQPGADPPHQAAVFLAAWTRSAPYWKLYPGESPCDDDYLKSRTRRRAESLQPEMLRLFGDGHTVTHTLNSVACIVRRLS